jgi:ribose transport system ATP-binding protein
MSDGIRIRAMSKIFEGVTVLDGVDLDIAPGEVHGLVGENGSGKSTLVKILGGLYSPEAGSSCTIWGEPLHFPVVRPQQHGIAIIHQDLALSDGMSVTENIGVSSGFGTSLLGPYRRSRERAAVRQLLADLDLRLNPDAPVGTLTPAERSLVGILRALRILRKHREHELLILDEPTAALTHAESQRLLDIIRSLAARNTAVLFISHRLQEVLAVCDRVSVLRSGKLVGTVATAETTASNLVRMMLGYDIGAFYPERHGYDGRVELLSVDGLSGGTVNGLSFKAYPGEILGVTGLTGMGQDEIPYLLVGHTKRTGGSVSVGGIRAGHSVPACFAAGMALVPGNRQRDSVWMAGSAAENLTLPFVGRFARRKLLSKMAEAAFTRDEMRRFSVRPLEPLRHVSRFSGGNQQKLVLARWLQTRPRVLLLHEPTQGVDAGAKKELFELIRNAADDGAAVVMFSSDVEEVANMCHRVLVLHHGSLAAEIPESQLSEETIVTASQGTSWPLPGPATEVVTQ